MSGHHEILHNFFLDHEVFFSSHTMFINAQTKEFTNDEKTFIHECVFDTKLDVDPRRDDDASPMSSYRCLLRPT